MHDERGSSDAFRSEIRGWKNEGREKNLDERERIMRLIIALMFFSASYAIRAGFDGGKINFQIREC